jgi:hypothetical protein
MNEVVESGQLTTDEYDWAQQTFSERYLAEDGCCRPTPLAEGPGLCLPRYDGKITINLGPEAYEDPRAFDAATFIHELTHTWQIEHVNIEINWLADAR